jgi:hypothetical protein
VKAPWEAVSLGFGEDHSYSYSASRCSAMAASITSYVERLQYLEISMQATVNGILAYQLVASNAAYQRIFVTSIWFGSGSEPDSD